MIGNPQDKGKKNSKTGGKHHILLESITYMEFLEAFVGTATTVIRTTPLVHLMYEWVYGVPRNLGSARLLLSF